MARWYAVEMNREDNDWGYGSYDLEEAKEMLKNFAHGLIAVIEEGDDPICVEEITYNDVFGYKVYACGGEHDGECVAEFENDALAINYCYDHENDYPLGHSIVGPDGKVVENW